MELSDMIGSSPADGIFKTLFENSVIGMSITSFDGMILTNAAFRLMVGYTEEELASLKWMNLTHPDDIALDNQMAKSLMSGERESCRWQKRYIHKNGNIVYVDISSVIHRDENGKPLFFTTTVSDVTAQVTLKNRLAESEAMIQESQKIAFLGTYNFDLFTGFWSSSEILDEIFGIDENYVRSFEGWSLVIHPDWRAEMVDYVTNYVVAEKHQFDKEYKIIRQNDRQERWVHGRGRLEFDASGHPQRLIGTIIDITTVKNTELAHRQSLEKLRILADNLSGFIAYVDADTLRYEFVNAMFEKSFGIPVDKIIGSHIKDIISEENYRFALKYIEEVKLGHPISYENVFNMTTGQRWVQVNYTPVFDSRGKVTSIVAHSYDITERKQMELDLVAGQNRVNRQRNAIAELVTESSVMSGNVHAAINRITELISYVFEVERTSLWLVFDDGEILKCVSLFGTDGGSIREGLVISATDYPRYFAALATGEIINASDARSDERTSEFSDHYLTPFGMESILDVPVMVDGTLAGVLSLEKAGGGRVWKPDEEAFATTVASFVSLVFTNDKRKKSEIALRESEERYRLLIDLLPTLVFVKDVDGHFVAANAACARYLGLSSPDEMMGKTDEDFYSPEVAKVFRSDELQVMKGFPLINKEETSQDSPPNQRFFLTSKVPLYSADGKFNGILGTSLDITEHKKAEIIQLIQINIAREVVVVETLVQMVTTVRTELMRIMDAKNFFVALYDGETDTLKKVLFIDQKDEFTEWKADSSLSGQVVKNRKTILLNRTGIEKISNDKKFNFLGTPAECWLGVPLIIDNKVIGVMVVQSYTNPNAYNRESAALLEMVAHELSLYIDRIKMIDDLVAAKDKAEESDRLKTAFLANMSHEIRTPLNSIIGFSDLLVEDVNEMEDVLKYAGIIRSSGDRLLNLISNLIDISKIESGTERIRMTKFSPVAVLREVIAQFQYRPLKESIQIRVKIPDQLKDRFIETDTMKFQQVFTNLINNAFKFTEKGFVEIGIEDTPVGLLYFVRDSGIGIPEDRIDRVFDRFYQVDATIIRRFEGAGLGLSLCKGMIELLGGKIWVESQVGKGSKFTFTLPA